MKENLTRGELRSLIDPELITELSRKPINPMKVGKYLYHREAAWKMLILQTVLPFCRHQLRYLEHYSHLLSDGEKQTADNYARLISRYETDWRSHLFSFPPQPEEFVSILLK